MYERGEGCSALGDVRVLGEGRKSGFRIQGEFR